MEIEKENLDAINLEIKKMRKELFLSYFEFLLNFYRKSIVQDSLDFFMAMPSITIKGKSTICILLECCECALQRYKD